MPYQYESPKKYKYVKPAQVVSEIILPSQPAQVAPDSLEAITSAMPATTKGRSFGVAEPSDLRVNIPRIDPEGIVSPRGKAGALTTNLLLGGAELQANIPAFLLSLISKPGQLSPIKEGKARIPQIFKDIVDPAAKLAAGLKVKGESKAGRKFFEQVSKESFERPEGPLIPLLVATGGARGIKGAGRTLKDKTKPVIVDVPLKSAVTDASGALRKSVELTKKSIDRITAKELNNLRRANINEADIRVGFATERLRNKIPDVKRREAITDAIEKPELRKDLNPAEQGVMNEVNKFYADGLEIAKEADVINSALENYINHVWEKGGKQKIFSGKFISKTTPFAKQRKIPTFAEGEKLGLKPLTKDPTKLMDIWSRSVNRAIHNKSYLDELRNITNDAGEKLIQPATSAPDWYVSVDHPSLKRYVWHGDKEGKGRITQTGVKAHPDIAGDLDVAFGQGFNPTGKWSQKTFNAYEAIDKAAKKSILTTSLFHYHALTESAISTGQSPWAFIKGAAKLVGDEELIVRARRAQLQIGGTPDVSHQALRFEKVPILRNTVGKIIEKNDKFLWDNLHAGHKIEAFDRLTRDALTNPKYSHMKPAKIDQVVAKFVNDAFGGLDWEGLGVTTKQQWLLQRGLLAPDWTLSQVRVAKGAFGRGLSGKLYRDYWKRTAFFNLGGANALNYVFTAWKAGDPSEGHFMVQNKEGHRFQLELPYKGSDGEPRYVRIGKQYLEPFGYIEDLVEGTPIKTVTNKMGPTNRIILGLASNQKWLGGPRIFKRDDPGYLKYLKTAEYIGTGVAPIPLQQYIDAAKGKKDLTDAAISSLGFPVKKDFSKKKSGRSGGR